MSENEPIAPATLDVALFYASLGLRVLPIDHGSKHPRMLAWQKAATTDPQIIKSWWTGLYSACGIGIATGGGSNVFVLDVDLDEITGKNGFEQLDDLQDLYGGLPPTVEAVTGSGGAHLFFRWPTNGQIIRNSASGALGVGLDVRGIGGQVVVAPTVHRNGETYAWRPGRAPGQIEIAEAPSWLLELLDDQPIEPIIEPRLGERSGYGSDRLAGVTGAGASHRPGSIAGDDGRTPAEWFHANSSWDELLWSDGWTLTGTTGDEQRWTRPGKSAREGISATVGHHGDELHVFTSSVAELVADRSYSRFGYEAAMRFGGDRAALARHVRTVLMPDRSSERDNFDWIASSGGSMAPRAPRAAVGGARLPEHFWSARSELETIRTAAHARMRSADAVFHVVLARISSQLAHTIDLPPIVGSSASLNYFAALIGPSGAGKSSAVRVANELTPAVSGLRIADGLPLGSGEGIAEAFMGEIADPDDPKRKTRGQVLWNAFLYGDEGEALLSIGNRQGSTILETLRRGWSGETLGQTNASAERKRIIPRGSYRLGLVIGFQPAKAGMLVGDHVGGTPQRFIWASAIDETIPDELPSFPGRLEWSPPSVGALADHEAAAVDGLRRFHVGVDPAIVTEIRTAARQQLRGAVTVVELDAHGMLHRLKIAALLAILNGRIDVDLEDWSLAKIVWATSCAVRTEVVAKATSEAELIEAVSIGKHARREQAAALARGNADAVALAHAVRLAGFVGQAETGATFSRRELSNRLNSRSRHLLEDVLLLAVEHGWLAETADGFYALGETTL